MNEWNAILMAQEHCDELLRQVQQEQMVRSAFPNRVRRHPIACRLLCWLGRELVVLGSTLQEQFGRAPEGAVWQPAGSAR